MLEAGAKAAVGAPLAAPFPVGHHATCRTNPATGNNSVCESTITARTARTSSQSSRRNRRHLLGEIVNDEMQVSVAGSLVIEAWSGLPARFPNVELDAFVVMPNHVHGILWLLHDDLPRAVEGSASGAPTTASPPQTGAVGRATIIGR